MVFDIQFNASIEIVWHIFTTAAFRTNYLKGCPPTLDKELKKEERASHGYRNDANSGLHVVKWCDNKCHDLASMFSGVNAADSVKRWDLKTKNHKDVSLPDMVSDYNSSMGGVDLADMLIALYYCNLYKAMLHKYNKLKNRLKIKKSKFYMIRTTSAP